MNYALPRNSKTHSINYPSIQPISHGIYMIQLDAIDKNILNMIQLDFPMGVHPFEELSDRLDISEKELLQRLERLNREGALRRIGPIINTKKTGGISTLVAIKVPDSKINEIAKRINEHPEVSHNYLRHADYNIWFTLSAPSREHLDHIINTLKNETGYPVIDLPTIRLFKIGVKFNVR